MPGEHTFSIFIFVILLKRPPSPEKVYQEANFHDPDLCDHEGLVTLYALTPPSGHSNEQGWTGMYTLVVPSLSAKLIKNSRQNLPIQPIFRDKA